MKKIIPLIMSILVLTSCGGGDLPSSSSSESSSSQSTSSSSESSSSSSSELSSSSSSEQSSSSDSSSESSSESSSSSSSSEGSSSSSESSSSSSSSPSTSSSESSSSDSSSSEDEYKVKSIQEIYTLGSTLQQDILGEYVTFYGKFVKTVTDNLEKLMLVVNGNDYMYVRFSSAKYTAHIKNLYTNTDLGFKGRVTKHLSNVEVSFDELIEKNVPTISYNLDNITSKKDSIKEVYDELKLLSLSSKHNAVGKIVTVTGQAVATDRSDANTKVVISDGVNTITVINDKKLISVDDVLNTYTVTGSLSILKSSPAILVLDMSLESSEKSAIDETNAVEVLPSYFSKWYIVSDKYVTPGLDDYSKLYKTTCYIGDDTGRATTYYLGGVDTKGGSLDDNGVKTSIKGFFLMNYWGLSESDLSKVSCPFGAYYLNDTQVTFVFSMHQFEPTAHGWKMFGFESTIKDA